MRQKGTKERQLKKLNLKSLIQEYRVTYQKRNHKMMKAKI